MTQQPPQRQQPGGVERAQPVEDLPALDAQPCTAGLGQPGAFAQADDDGEGDSRVDSSQQGGQPGIEFGRAGRAESGRQSHGDHGEQDRRTRRERQPPPQGARTRPGAPWSPATVWQALQNTLDWAETMLRSRPWKRSFTVKGGTIAAPPSAWFKKLPAPLLV